MFSNEESKTPPRLSDILDKKIVNLDEKPEDNEKNDQLYMSNDKLSHDDALRHEMLITIFSSSFTIIKSMINEDRQKLKDRKRFKLFFMCMLPMLIILLILSVVFDAVTDFDLSIELIIGAFSTIIANIFAIVVLMVKYANDSKHLEVFETISKGLLEHLAKMQTERKE